MPHQTVTTSLSLCRGGGGGGGSSSTVGLFQRTRMNLFIPPQLGRLLVAAAVVVGQSFLIAYKKEAKRANEEERYNERETGQQGGTVDKPVMTAAEAVQILGVERVNPKLLKDPWHISLPLSRPDDLEAARGNFHRMMAVAQKQENHFLMGKLSMAYRLCVDPNWDVTQSSSSDPEYKDREGSSKPE